MTRAERCKAGARLCRQLTDWLGRKMTPGLGHWSPAWEIVAAPSDVFMDALHRWEVSGSEEDWKELDRAYRALALAWHEAHRRFLDVGHAGRVPA